MESLILFKYLIKIYRKLCSGKNKSKLKTRNSGTWLKATWPKSKNLNKATNSMKIRSTHCWSSMKGYWLSSKQNWTNTTQKNLIAASPFSPYPKSLKETLISQKSSILLKPQLWNPEITKTVNKEGSNKERTWCWAAINRSYTQSRQVLQITIVIILEEAIKWRKSSF